MPHCPEGLVLALWRECTPPGRTTHLTQTSSHPVLHEPSDCNDMSAGCVCTRVVGGIMHPRSRFALWWTKPVSLERQSHPPAQHLNDPKQGAHHCRIMRPDMLATVAACSAPPPVTRSPPLTPATPCPAALHPCLAARCADPRVDGLGVSNCIKLALRDARIERDQVNYINAHATRWGDAPAPALTQAAQAAVGAGRPARAITVSLGPCHAGSERATSTPKD